MICSSTSEQETENNYFKVKNKQKLYHLNSHVLDMNINGKSLNKSMPALNAADILE